MNPRLRAWLCAVAAVAACSTSRPALGPPVDAAALVTRQGPRQLSCAHCHADAEALKAGRISPGPPWPGAAQRKVLRGRAQGLREAVRSCAVDHAGAPLSDVEADAITRWLVGQGPALPGQPARYGAGPRPREDILAMDLMAGDAWRGEALFPRTCGACHGDEDSAVSYDLPTLRAQSPREVLLKVLGAPQQGDHMPVFVEGTLSEQDALDLAVWVGGQG